MKIVLKQIFLLSIFVKYFSTKMPYYLFWNGRFGLKMNKCKVHLLMKFFQPMNKIMDQVGYKQNRAYFYLARN